MEEIIDKQNKLIQGYQPKLSPCVVRDGDGYSLMIGKDGMIISNGYMPIPCEGEPKPPQGGSGVPIQIKTYYGQYLK